MSGPFPAGGSLRPQRTQEAPILKRIVWIPLLCLSLALGGCASRPALGELVEDASRRAALLQAYERPQVREAVFRTLIRWPGRALSLTEIVKVPPEGGFLAAGITDLGSTLYAVQITATGESRVLNKSLPFSDRWLLDGFVAELLIPWHGPHPGCQLHRQADGTWALADRVGDNLHLFTFDGSGRWQEVRRFAGGRLRCRAFLEWDGGPVPKVIRADNPGNRYHTVRERISLR